MSNVVESQTNTYWLRTSQRVTKKSCFLDKKKINDRKHQNRKRVVTKICNYYSRQSQRFESFVNACCFSAETVWMSRETLSLTQVKHTPMWKVSLCLDAAHKKKKSRQTFPWEAKKRAMFRRRSWSYFVIKAMKRRASTCVLHATDVASLRLTFTSCNAQRQKEIRKTLLESCVLLREFWLARVLWKKRMYLLNYTPCDSRNVFFVSTKKRDIQKYKKGSISVSVSLFFFPREAKVVYFVSNIH